MEKKINYKSDFDFVLDLRDCNDEPILWPAYGDWNVTLWSGVRTNTYRVGVADGEPYGCYEDNERIHVVMDGHSLGAGVLRGELTINEPSERYPDGVKRHVYDFTTDIELVAGGGCCGGETLTAVAMLPVTTVELFGATVDEINAQLTEVLHGGINGSISEADKAKLADLPTAEELADTFQEKVDKEPGKGLSTNDYTDEDKAKVDAIGEDDGDSKTKGASTVNGPRILQWGMISLGAVEGVIYRDLGYIRCGVITEDDRIKGEPVVYDISGVDSDIIQGYKASFNSAGEINWSTKTLTFDMGAMSEIKQTRPVCVRLILKQATGRGTPYLTRTSDGIIRRIEPAFGVLEVAPPKPRIPKRLWACYDILDILREIHKMTGRVAECQFKAKRAWRDFENADDDDIPMRYNMTSPCWKNFNYSGLNKKTGVARVRFSTTRNQKGPWAVFTFHITTSGMHIKEL